MFAKHIQKEKANKTPRLAQKERRNKMIIDFEKTEEKVAEKFKGGIGQLFMRSHDDGEVKIMRDRLPAGCSIGMHTHEGNCEIMYILKGEITFVCDGKEEVAHVGEVHYCPCGHTHCAENRTNEDAEFFAIVPTMSQSVNR